MMTLMTISSMMKKMRMIQKNKTGKGCRKTTLFFGCSESAAGLPGYLKLQAVHMRIEKAAVSIMEDI